MFLQIDLYVVKLGDIVNNKNLTTKKIVFLGLMLALIIILSIFENMLPPLPFLPANFKLGISNIIIMYCLFFTGIKETIILVILKSIFNLLMKGPVVGLLSLSGGILSVTSIIILYFLFKNRISVITISVFGAIFHNIGQLLAASFLLKSFLLFYYFPVLLIVGIVMGSITGISLKIIIPVFNSIFTDNK